MKPRWGVVLCTCNDTLPVDRTAIGRGLGLPLAPATYSRLPRGDIDPLMRLVARERFDRVLVACCGPPELFAEAMGAAGADATPLEVVSLRERCYWLHAERDAANRKATRLLRAAMRGAEGRREAPEHSLRVGPRVVIVADSPLALDLARRLAELATPTLVLDEASDRFDPAAIHPLPWKASWGRVAEIRGRLGAFQVVVEQRQPIDLETCIACGKCVPVCHTQAISDGLRLREALCDRCGDCLTACEGIGAIRIPRSDRRVIPADQIVVLAERGERPGPTRTGHHVLVGPAAGEVEAVAWRVVGLMGDFQKPEHVAYQAETCAGGGSGKRGCGICIQVCPYEAIERDGLRVRVDQLACEGCGACVGACPTSSLRFTDPSARELFDRLAALLEPIPGATDERPVVCFHCPEKGEAALGAAGRTRRASAASVLPVPVPCLRYVSEADILGAFRLGAAAVALLGCARCPHGERRALEVRLETCRTVLDAFGAGGHRIRLVTVDGSSAEALAGLDELAATVGPSPLPWSGPLPATEHRAVIADTLAALLAATERDPGRVPAAPEAAFGYPEVRAPGCTLCRSCVNVCPTHAFRLVEATHTLELKHVSCVACGLCAQVCPEHVITLRRELPLGRSALEYQPVVQDELVGCAQCGKPYINRRALEAVEAKLLELPQLVDTFAGSRRNLLRMCPNCRAVAAVFETHQGWEP